MLWVNQCLGKSNWLVEKVIWCYLCQQYTVLFIPRAENVCKKQLEKFIKEIIEFNDVPFFVTISENQALNHWLNCGTSETSNSVSLRVKASYISLQLCQVDMSYRFCRLVWCHGTYSISSNQCGNIWWHFWFYSSVNIVSQC